MGQVGRRGALLPQPDHSLDLAAPVAQAPAPYSVHYWPEASNCLGGCLTPVGLTLEHYRTVCRIRVRRICWMVVT